MARILDFASGSRLLAAPHNRETWSAVVAAAGRGTRLGFDKPKILFPVAGITILERLIRLLEPLCSQIVFVLSPDGAPVVEPEIERALGARGRIAIQPTPLGMADAVECGLSKVNTARSVVVWGDQFALKRSSLEFCMRVLDGAAPAGAVCPTLLRREPYIHLERDAAGRVLRVLQKREGDPMPPEGESDAGVFFFDTEALRSNFHMLNSVPDSIGARTRERNFLPILPLFDALPGHLITPRIMTEEESVGVNTREDALFLESSGIV